MATDTPQQPASRELAALRDLLVDIFVVVYLPATGRLIRCPNLLAPPHRCEREATFTISEAQLVAARIKAGELGPISPDLGPIVLVYGIPWSWGRDGGQHASPSP